MLLRGTEIWNLFGNAHLTGLQSLSGCSFFACEHEAVCGLFGKNNGTLKGFVDKFQQVSVDEAYLVLGSDVRNFEEAVLYALRIKDEVQKQEGISCSFGVGPNRL